MFEHPKGNVLASIIDLSKEKSFKNGPRMSDLTCLTISSSIFHDSYIFYNFREGNYLVLNVENGSVDTIPFAKGGPTSIQAMGLATPNGQIFIDNSGTIFNHKTHTQVTIPGYTESILNTISSDGTRVALLRKRDRTLRVFDVSKKEFIFELANLSNLASDTPFALSGDGSHLALITTHDNMHIAHKYNIDKKQETQKIAWDIDFSIRLNKTGSTLIGITKRTSLDESIRISSLNIFDITTQNNFRITGKIQPHESMSPKDTRFLRMVIMSPDGTWIAAMDTEEAIYAWNLADINKLGTYQSLFLQMEKSTNEDIVVVKKVLDDLLSWEARGLVIPGIERLTVKDELAPKTHKPRKTSNKRKSKS